MAGRAPAVVAAAEDESGDNARDEGLALSKEDMLRDKVESQQVLIRHLKAEKEKLSLSLAGLPVIYKIMQDLENENKLLKEEHTKARAALTTCVVRLQSLGIEPTSCDAENAEQRAAALPQLVDRLLQENAQLKNHLSQLITNPSGDNNDTSNSAMMIKQKADIDRLSGQLRQLEAVLSGSADLKAAEVGRLSAEATRLRDQLQLVSSECCILRSACDQGVTFESVTDIQQESGIAAQQRLSLAQKVVELDKMLREQKTSYERIMVEKQRLAVELDAARTELATTRRYPLGFLHDTPEQPLRAPAYAQASPDRATTRGNDAATTKPTDLQLAGHNASAARKGRTYDSEHRQLPPPS